MQTKFEIINKRSIYGYGARLLGPSSSPLAKTVSRSVLVDTRKGVDDNKQRAMSKATMYIQYFWIKVFSGPVWTGAPSAVSGGGAWRVGLEGVKGVADIYMFTTLTEVGSEARGEARLC